MAPVFRIFERFALPACQAGTLSGQLSHYTLLETADKASREGEDCAPQCQPPSCRHVNLLRGC